MTQYNVLNVKLSNSQLNKLKSAIKYGIDVMFHQMLPEVVTAKIIFYTNYY